MIYCVEDDNGIRELMVYTLNASGFQAEGFPDGKAFWNAMSHSLPQLIMLDIMLPGEDGISLLKKIRNQASTADIPVIMATAKGTEYDKVIGLDTGADDYLAKPFGMMEMVSRVRAVLRRVTTDNKAKILKVGDLEMSIDEHIVTVHGKRIQLTLKEFDLLYRFMSNTGIVFTREKLLCIVWGDDFAGETRTVDVHIGTLRTKLGDCGSYIETVRGVGYRMGEIK